MRIEKDVMPGAEATALLQRKLEDKTAQVGVIGLGYVGLPLALLFARKGFSATGFDVDPAKVAKLERGESYIRHISPAAIAEEVERKRFRATDDFAALEAMDACLVCVPTPLDEHREPDLSYIRNTAEEISAHLRPGQLIVLESTTYPGTTEEVMLPILERSGLRCPIATYHTDGRAVESRESLQPDFLLAFSPEREDPGNKEFQTHRIPKLIGAVNGPSALAAQALYGEVFERTLLVSSSKVAEMAKLLENIYRCVNIALINELKLLSLRMGIDVWEVIEAAKTKPFGFTAFYPGPGLGGHCIPIDPFYLTWKAREYEFPTRFIELAGEINASMPDHVVAAVGEALNHRQQCLQGSRILILGIAYKKDVDDLRESPALRIMELLTERGARVDYHDPYFPRLHKMRRYDFRLSSIDLTPEALSGYDAVVIATNHSSYDYDSIVRHARLVLDTRNATSNVRENREKIVRC
jgi:UDP-N-acetyl-D-glucosamine dehydrogenase